MNYICVGVADQQETSNVTKIRIGLHMGGFFLKMKKIVVISLIVAAMLLTGCTKKENLTVGIMPDLDSIPFVVAKQQGYFDDVTLEIYKSPVDRDSAFYSGNLDGSISDALAACLAKKGDFSVYITSKTNGRYGIVAGMATGITTPKNVRRKRSRDESKYDY